MQNKPAWPANIKFGQQKKIQGSKKLRNISLMSIINFSCYSCQSVVTEPNIISVFHNDSKILLIIAIQTTDKRLDELGRLINRAASLLLRSPASQLMQTQDFLHVYQLSWQFQDNVHCHGTHHSAAQSFRDVLCLYCAEVKKIKIKMRENIKK